MPAGVALVCDGEGIIESIISGGEDALLSGAEGKNLGSFIEPQNVSQLQLFLDKISATGAEFNREFYLSLGGKAVLLFFSGVKLEANRFVLLGLGPPEEISLYYQGLLEILSFQSRALREAAKRLGKNGEVMDRGFSLFAGKKSFLPSGGEDS